MTIYIPMIILTVFLAFCFILSLEFISMHIMD